MVIKGNRTISTLILNSRNKCKSQCYPPEELREPNVIKLRSFLIAAYLPEYTIRILNVHTLYTDLVHTYFNTKRSKHSRFSRK